MKRLLFFLAFAALVGLFAHDGRAQDFTQTAVFTGAANGPSVQANSGGPNGAGTVVLTWFVSGFTAAKIHLQGSQDNSTFADITTSSLLLDGSSNPVSWTSSTTSNRIAVRAYLPWYRVAVDTLTGSGKVTTYLLGYKGSTAAPIGTSAGGSSNVTIVSPIGQTTMSGSVSVAIASDQSSVPVSFGASSTVLSNQQAVTGSAVNLGTNTIKQICVSAFIGNTINVYLGPSGITTSTGTELPPGAGRCLSVTNTNLLYVIASTTGASVSWIATN